MWIVAVTAIVAVPLALLLIPVGISYRAAWPGTDGNFVAVRWAFGLVRFRTHLAPPPKAAAAAAHDRPARPAAGNGTAAVRQLLKDAAGRRRLLRFSRDLWRSLHARDVYARLRIGLDDPADTGRLWAVAGPVAAAAAGVPGATLRIEPDFAGETLTIDSGGRFRCVPLLTLWHVVTLLLSSPVRTARRRAQSRGS
ncbi:MAG: hypothetical protein AAFX58_08025 [Pseudomonadota bacterium]